MAEVVVDQFEVVSEIGTAEAAVDQSKAVSEIGTAEVAVDQSEVVLLKLLLTSLK